MAFFNTAPNLPHTAKSLRIVLITAAALTLLLILLFTLLLGVSSKSIGHDSVHTQIEEVISGEFELQNHLDEPVSEANYNGQYRLVFFGFVQCPDICPTTMVQLSEVMKQLGDKQVLVKPLFISVDHENDSIQQLAEYVSYFHPSFDGLTGTPEQIENAAKGFNTTYGKNSDTASETQTGYYHSSYIYLMDKDGKLIDLFSHATSAEVILAQIESLL